MPDVDLVIVGAPNDVHCEIAVAAFEAGKHVVMEKPLALNLGETDRMIAAAARAGRKLIECVRNDRQPLVTGEDGRAVLEILFAAYESAGTSRKVPLPFQTDAARPIDLWKRRQQPS